MNTFLFQAFALNVSIAFSLESQGPAYLSWLQVSPGASNSCDQEILYDYFP